MTGGRSGLNHRAGSDDRAEVDERGVRLDAPWYPHTTNCIRRAMNLTNPQACDCGGDEKAEELRRG